LCLSGRTNRASSFELQPNQEEAANPFPFRKLYVPAFSPKELLPALGEDLPFEEFSIMQHAQLNTIPKIPVLVKRLKAQRKTGKVHNDSELSILEDFDRGRPFNKSVF
jgi:hypothetical protein